MKIKDGYITKIGIPHINYREIVATCLLLDGSSNITSFFLIGKDGCETGVRWYSDEIERCYLKSRVLLRMLEGKVWLKK